LGGWTSGSKILYPQWFWIARLKGGSGTNDSIKSLLLLKKGDDKAQWHKCNRRDHHMAAA
jgi:hypothetical protein